MVSHTLYSSVVMSACVCRCVCWCVGQMVGMDKRELLCDPQVAVHRIQPAKRHYNTWRRLRVEREGNNEWRRHSRTQTNTASKRQRAQRLKRMPVLSVYFSLTAVSLLHIMVGYMTKISMHVIYFTITKQITIQLFFLEIRLWHQHFR